jgi:hypothetical protein
MILRLMMVFFLISLSEKGLCEEPRISKEPALLTVCDVLGQRHQYHGKVVVIVGVRASTDEGQWLFDKSCSRQVTTQGFNWGNDISLEWAPTIAPDPSGWPVIDETELGRKLELVKQRNKLREFRHGNLDFSDRWVAAYGRFESPADLKPPKGKGVKREWGNGYGHLGGSPAQLLIREGSVRYLKDYPAKTVGR